MLIICTEGFWIAADFLYEVRWYEGHQKTDTQLFFYSTKKAKEYKLGVTSTSISMIKEYGQPGYTHKKVADSYATLLW